jgi:hypothetical protein
MVNPSADMMINIRGIALNFGAPWINIPLVLSVIVIVLYAARLSADWRWFGAAVAGSPLIVPHVYLYDLSSLLVFLLAALTTAKSPLTRWTAFLIILPPIHGAIALGTPWAALPPLAIMALLLCLALEGDGFRWDRGLHCRNHTARLILGRRGTLCDPNRPAMS